MLRSIVDNKYIAFFLNEGRFKIPISQKLQVKLTPI